MILASDVLAGAGSNSDAWKTGYMLVIFDSCNSKLIGPVCCFILNAPSFLKSNFSLGCFIFKNLRDK